MSYAIVFVGFVGQILLQFALQLILADWFGTAIEMDAYMAAMTFPVTVGAILAGGIGPLMVTALNRQSPADAAPVPLLLWGGIAAASVVAVLSVTAAESLMAWLHPGFDATMTARSASLFRILVWLAPANTAIGLFQAIVNGRRRFALPALAGVLGPLATVVVILASGQGGGIRAVAWGTLLGAAVNVAIQFPSLWAGLPRLDLSAAATACRDLIPLATPIFLGMLLLKVDPLVDRSVSSFLDDGSIARYGYATRFVSIFVMLASGTLSTVSFPRIAEAAALGREQGTAAVAQALRMLITLTLPAAVVLVGFSEPLVRDVFERGAFTAADTAAVARLMQISTLLLIGAAGGELFTKAFYVLRDSRTPTALSAVLLLCGAVAKLVLVPDAGIDMLAAISAVTVFVGGSLLPLLLIGRLGKGMLEGCGPHFVKSLSATAVAAGIGYVLLRTGIPFAAVIGLTIGGAAYFSLLGAIDRRSREFLRHLRQTMTGR